MTTTPQEPAPDPDVVPSGDPAPAEPGRAPDPDPTGVPSSPPAPDPQV